MSLATEADIRAAFQKFDVDGNGFLSLDELKALLQRSGGGKALTDDEVSEFMYRIHAGATLNGVAREGPSLTTRRPGWVRRHSRRAP